MKLVHTLPFLIRDSNRESDLAMATKCLQSLSLSTESEIVVFNQGCLTNNELIGFLSGFALDFAVIGAGSNVGIAQGRQSCFEYVWSHLPNREFISEIHLDMIFPKNWTHQLVRYLSTSGDPMICPGIVTARSELHPERTVLEVDVSRLDEDTLQGLLNALRRDQIAEGFVHPVVHNTTILKDIGGYDFTFLRGKQGYEDDSLLLGYLYYMGIKSRWRPKCLLNTWVFHQTLAQRMFLPGKEQDFQDNLDGLIAQYGAYGLKHLHALHGYRGDFQLLFNHLAPKSLSRKP